jgi:hypothetical protein
MRHNTATKAKSIQNNKTCSTTSETTHQGNIKASNPQDNQTYNTATNAAQPPQANSATTVDACRMSLHEHRS